MVTLTHLQLLRYPLKHFEWARSQRDAWHTPTGVAEKLQLVFCFAPLHCFQALEGPGHNPCVTAALPSVLYYETTLCNPRFWGEFFVHEETPPSPATTTEGESSVMLPWDKQCQASSKGLFQVANECRRRLCLVKCASDKACLIFATSSFKLYSRAAVALLFFLCLNDEYLCRLDDVLSPYSGQCNPIGLYSNGCFFAIFFPLFP